MNSARRVAVLALVAVGSAGFGFPPPRDLACPAGTQLRRVDSGLSSELYCARADGTRHGPSRRFEIGERTEGSFANDQKVGLWRTWYANGRPRLQRRYVMGRIEGLETTWNLDGTVATRGSYRADKREGPWTETDLTVTGRGNYRRDAREGPWSFFSEGHRTAAGSYRDGGFDGPWTFYWPGGALESRGTFRRSLKQGRWRYYEPKGWLRIDIECRGGRAHGRFIELDERGRIVMEGAFLDGVGRVARRDGTSPGFSLCGDDCWAYQHCDTEDHDYRTAEGP